MSVTTEALLNTAITSDITTNNNNEITGAQLNAILGDMVDSSLSRKGTNNHVVLDVEDNASSTVNYILVKGVGASGKNPGFYGTGDSAQVDIQLEPKGAGAVRISGASSPGLQFDVDGKGIVDVNSNELLTFVRTGSALNELTITNAASGNPPILSASGEADIGVQFNDSNGNELVILNSVASAVNHLEVTNSIADNAVLINSIGTDTNITITLTPKGAGLFKVGAATTMPALAPEAATATNPTLLPYSDDPDTGIGWSSSNIFSAIGGGTEIVRFTSVSSGVNTIVLTNAATLNAPVISVEGDTNQDIKIAPAGTGSTILIGTGAKEALKVTGLDSAVNYLEIKNSANTASLKATATGTDTNIDVDIIPKGAGTLTVAGTTNYEDNVTHDDDIPNKKWIDDQSFAGGTLTVDKVTISSAEIKALNTTKKELIAAPGSGIRLIVLNILLEYNYGTATYTNGGDFDFEYAGETVYYGQLNNGIYTAGTDRMGNLSARDNLNVGGGASDNYDNGDFSVRIRTSDPATGDGTIDLYITYLTTAL